MNNKPSYLEIFLTRLAFRFFGKSVYKRFADRLPLDGDEYVLDFGSGMGTVAFYLVKRLPRIRLFCTDISARWLAACCRTMSRSPGVSYLLGDIYNLPLAKGSFDLIYCHFVLHDIPESELTKVVPALVQLLKAEGLLVFREPLSKMERLGIIQNLLEQNGLAKKSSRITDTTIIGNTLESTYIKL